MAVLIRGETAKLSDVMGENSTQEHREDRSLSKYDFDLPGAA
jgi:hypothetical protein